MSGPLLVDISLVNSRILIKGQWDRNCCIRETNNSFAFVDEEEVFDYSVIYIDSLDVLKFCIEDEYIASFYGENKEFCRYQVRP